MKLGYEAYRAAGLVFVFVGVVVVVYVAANAPFSPGKRLGLRGLKRQRMLARSETWAALEPVVRWLGMRALRQPDCIDASTGAFARFSP